MEIHWSYNKCKESPFSLFYRRPVAVQSPQPPQYVFWQKNERMINYDDSRRDITIETSPGPRTQSRLIIREPQIADSGNYTCSASNTEPASIYVFVSKGNEWQLIYRARMLLHRIRCQYFTTAPPHRLLSCSICPRPSRSLVA